MTSYTIRNAPTKIWNATTRRPALIANLDLVNTLYVAPGQNVQASSDQVPPLGSLAFDGATDVWASTLSTSTITVLAIPGGTSWAPSPAQAAEQISALGLATQATQLTVAGSTATTATNTTGAAKDTSVLAVHTVLGAPAQDASVTTTLPGSLVASGIPPYLPNAQSFGYGPVTGGGIQTLVSWGSGTTYRIWDTYITLAADTNSAFTGSASVSAWIEDSDGNVYASAVLRFGTASQAQAVGVSFNAAGITLHGPQTINVNVSTSITNLVIGADGGVMISS